MFKRIRNTLATMFSGRGVIVWGGIIILLAVSSTEIVTLLQEGLRASSDSSIRGVATGLILSVALFLGRRWVALGLGIFLASSLYFFSDGRLLLWMLLSMAIFSALAATSPVVLVRIWFLAMLAAWMAQYTVRAGDDRILVVVLLPLAVLTYALTRVIFVLRERNAQALEDMHEAEQRTFAAIERERKNIARDLHDIVAHDITVVAMQSKAAKFANDGATALEAIDIISKLSSETLHDLRLMLNDLRTDGT